MRLASDVCTGIHSDYRQDTDGVGTVRYEADVERFLPTRFQGAWNLVARISTPRACNAERWLAPMG